MSTGWFARLTGTSELVAGDGTDGTGGPCASRDGGPVAVTSDRPAGGTVWDAWPVDPVRFAEAAAAAERFADEDSPTLATTAPWTDRLREAADGMDAADPTGMDAWAGARIGSATPHLHEARLVAAWETHNEPDTSADAIDEDGW